MYNYLFINSKEKKNTKMPSTLNKIVGYRQFSSKLFSQMVAYYDSMFLNKNKNKMLISITISYCAFNFNSRNSR